MGAMPCFALPTEFIGTIVVEGGGAMEVVNLVPGGCRREGVG